MTGGLCRGLGGGCGNSLMGELQGNNDGGGCQVHLYIFREYSLRTSATLSCRFRKSQECKRPFQVTFLEFVSANPVSFPLIFRAMHPCYRNKRYPLPSMMFLILWAASASIGIRG